MSSSPVRPVASAASNIEPGSAKPLSGSGRTGPRSRAARRSRGRRSAGRPPGSPRSRRPGRRRRQLGARPLGHAGLRGGRRRRRSRRSGRGACSSTAPRRPGGRAPRGRAAPLGTALMPAENETVWTAPRPVSPSRQAASSRRTIAWACSTSCRASPARTRRHRRGTRGRRADVASRWSSRPSGRTRSPAAWPLESLIRLKSSRSMIASDIERLAARRDGPLPLDLLLEGAVVAEAGEGVAERLGPGAVVGVLEDPARLLEALRGLEHAAGQPDRQGAEHDGQGQDRDRRDDERRAHPGREPVDERRGDHDRDREHRDEREEQAKTDEPKVRRFAKERVRTPRSYRG